MAIDDEFVYWVTAGLCPAFEPTGTGTLVRARRHDGSGAITIGDLPCPMGVTVLGDDLYWSNASWANGGSIWTARRTGEDARSLVETGRPPTTIRVDADHVYWFEANHYIYRLARATSSTPEVFAEIEISAFTDSVSAFVMDERYVYWMDARDLGDGGIYRAAKRGGTPEQVADANDPREIAISSEGLFWIEASDFSTQSLSMLRWGDLQPSRITLSTHTMALTAFGDQAYWVDGADGASGAVWSARFGDTIPFVLIAEQSGPRTIVADQEHLFWANQNYPEGHGRNGEIRRACRP